MPSSHDIPRIPLRTVGPYQLTAQLGQSTHGPAYIARIPGNDTTFSLKWFQRRIPPEEVARIRQEIQIVSRLNHPGIVVPVDFGLEKDRLYVVSEHIEGSTAQERLSTHGPMDTRDAARLVADLADALERAHQAGILHRDLKPANVIVDSRNRGRILDLGLGPSVSAAGTNTTPYQAPEQIRGERPSARTDVYALGAILYELLCCRPPYSGRSTQELADTILAGQLIPPRRLTAGIDPKVESICLSALSANPRKRPASAAAMAKSLRRAAEGGGGGVPIVLVALVGLIWLLSLAIPITLAVRYKKNLALSQRDSQAQINELTKTKEELEQSVTRITSRAEQAENAQRRFKDERDRHADQINDLKRQYQQVAADNATLNQQIQQLTLQSLEPLQQTALAIDTVIKVLEATESLEADRMRVDLLRVRGRYQQSAELAEALRANGKQDYDLAMSEFLSVTYAGDRERPAALYTELQGAPEGSAAREFAALASRNPEEEALVQALGQRIIDQGTSGNRYLDLLALTGFLPQPGRPASQQSVQNGMMVLVKLLPRMQHDAPLEPSYLQAAQMFYGNQTMAAAQQKKANLAQENYGKLTAVMRLSRELQPENLNLIATHAEQFLKLGAVQQAAGLFEAAIQIGDRLGRTEVRQLAQIGKGTALLMQKEVDEGLRSWKSVCASFGTQLTQHQQLLIFKIVEGLRYVPQDRLQGFIERDIPPSASTMIKQVLQQMQRQQQQQQRPPR